MTDLRARLADALADHMTTFNSCLCGEDDFTFADDWGRHLADVLLSLPGIAIVGLPQPDSTRYEGDEHEPEDRLCWMPGDEFEVSVWDQGEVQRYGYGWGDDSRPLSAAEASTIAAALLAAANAAEDADD